MPRYSKARFQLDGCGTYAGYDDGEDWNGWCVPILPRAEVESFLRNLSDGAAVSYSFLAGGVLVVSIVSEHYSVEETVKPVDIYGEDCYRLNWGFTFELEVD